jgi:hypothetical protein
MTNENARALENVIMFMIMGFHDSKLISRNEIVQILNNLNVRITEELSQSHADVQA